VCLKPAQDKLPQQNEVHNLEVHDGSEIWIGLASAQEVSSTWVSSCKVQQNDWLMAFKTVCNQ
jgi:hypothetical protein